VTPGRVADRLRTGTNRPTGHSLSDNSLTCIDHADVWTAVDVVGSLVRRDSDLVHRHIPIAIEVDHVMSRGRFSLQPRAERAAWTLLRGRQVVPGIGRGIGPYLSFVGLKCRFG
jgi:hypothetical protein